MTEKWRYWRVQLVDGTPFNVDIGDKANGKASSAVDHTKLASLDSIEKWRRYWKGVYQSFEPANSARSCTRGSHSATRMLRRTL
nr:hypothetical protein [Corynebacterium stationis]